MGVGGIGIWQLLIVLVIVMVIFGTSRLKSFGGDLGSAVKGFRQSMSGDSDHDGEEKKNDETGQPHAVKSEINENVRNTNEYKSDSKDKTV